MKKYIHLVGDTSVREGNMNVTYLRIAARIVETVAFEIAGDVPAQTVAEVLALACEIEKKAETVGQSS